MGQFSVSTFDATGRFAYCLILTGNVGSAYRNAPDFFPVTSPRAEQRADLVVDFG